jgi:hypothetical protein
MLGAQLKFESPCTTFRIFDSYYEGPYNKSSTLSTVMLAKWYFNVILFLGGLHTWKKYISMVVRFKSAMGFLFCARPTPRGAFSKWSKWPWNVIHLMPCRNIHVESTSILHSLTLLVPQPCEANLDHVLIRGVITLKKHSLGDWECRERGLFWTAK